MNLGEVELAAKSLEKAQQLDRNNEDIKEEFISVQVLLSKLKNEVSKFH